jgi:puromycin-sensitive aminopeptidase
MQMFDAITYGKGSAVMRMLEAYLGEDAFREGLRDYVDRFAEDNARGEDLWQVLVEASGEPVQAVMETWIRQPGHPRVRVEHDGEDRLTISQSRHRSTPDADTDATWPVPLVLAYADDTGIREHRVLVDQAETTVELPVEGEVDWLIANSDDVGFFRTELGEELRAQAFEHARELSPREQAALLRDEFGLVEAGRRDVAAYLDALDTLATGEAHFALVDAIVDHVRRVNRLLIQHGDEEALEAFHAWISDTFGPAMTRLGPSPTPGEDPAKRHRRARVLEAVALIGENKQARGAALEIYDREREDPDGVDPDTGNVAVRVNASTSDVAEVREYLKVYEARRDGDNPPQQAQRYLEALPAFETADAVEAVLDAIDQGRIPNQSIGPLLERMLAEPHAQYQALAYVDDNLETLHEHVGTAWIARIVEATGYVAPDLADDARSLLDEAEEIAPESTQRARERVDQGVEFHERVVDEMAAWWIDRA